MVSTLHPVVVHFPVALLTVYAVAELLRFKRVSGQPYWFYLKATLVLAGTLGALVARQTGEALVESFGGQGSVPPLVHIHSNWSLVATWVFAILSACYLAAWLHRESVLKHAAGDWCNRFVSSWLVAPLALLGLAAITITGALGGAIVYGPDIDPAVKLIYSIVVGPAN